MENYSQNVIRNFWLTSSDSNLGNVHRTKYYKKLQELFQIERLKNNALKKQKSFIFYWNFWEAHQFLDEAWGRSKDLTWCVLATK